MSVSYTFDNAYTGLRTWARKLPPSGYSNVTEHAHDLESAIALEQQRVRYEMRRIHPQGLIT